MTNYNQHVSESRIPVVFQPGWKTSCPKDMDIAFVRHVRGTDCDDRDNQDASRIIQG